MSPTAVCFLCSPLLAQKELKHALWEEGFASLALNVRGSDNSEKHAFEGAFFCCSCSVDGRSNKHLHFDWPLDQQKSLLSLESRVYSGCYQS